MNKDINKENLLKMAELASEVDLPKSTIQHYANNGLIPEGIKPSPNMKYYTLSTIEYIKIIKYLQNTLNYSINDISFLYKHIKIDFKDFSIDLTKLLYILVDDISVRQNLDLMSIIKLKREDLSFNANKFFQLSIPETFVDKLFEEKIFEEQEFYTFNDVELLKVAYFLNETMENLTIIKEYIESAKKIAIIEKTISDKLKEQKGDLDPIYTFEILLNIKPYLYNRETFKNYIKHIEI